MIRGGEHVINPIMRLNWAGWESDTLTLQRNGWEISVEQNVQWNSIQFALKHPGLHMYGISQKINFDYMQRIDELVMRGICIPIEMMAHNLRITTISSGSNFAAFQPIDAEPIFMEFEEKSIEDFKIFRSVQPKHEILVEPETVQSMLDKILEMQSPKQKEIRKRYLKERRIQEQQGKIIHAQILSMVA